MEEKEAEEFQSLFSWISTWRDEEGKPPRFKYFNPCFLGFQQTEESLIYIGRKEFQSLFSWISTIKGGGILNPLP